MADAALSADWTPPREVEEYRLLQLLGRGASGLVYLAQDTLLERLVALKFMLAIDADAIGRFLVEARATARLQHPNVVTLYRVGQLDDRPFLVSELVRGRSLAQIDKPLPWREALKVAIGVARGLAAAHRRGVLHRDIKPGNVMIGSAGEIKVLDFGLAKLDKLAVAPSQLPAPPSSPVPAPVIVMPQLTQRGLYFGTPFYMAPELWRREPATRRSDIYALGAVLYELCSGRTPLEGLAPADLPEAAQTRTPPSCASVCNETDATFTAFAALVDRCLCHDPERRFASAEELLDSLEELNRAHPAALVPKGNPYRGLQPFDSEHRALFFGRAGEIAAVVERLRGEPFVLLVGDSGVGKSSLASAGVLPSVSDGALEDGRRWTMLRMRPGRNPFATFVALLAPLVGGDEDALARELRSESLALSRRLRRMLAAERGLVVFVDQLEELLTVATPDEAEAFVRILHELADNIVGARLLATTRSDFLMRLAALPDLGDRISSALYLLRPPSKGGLCAAVVEPARATGIHFDSPALIERLVESTARTEGGLPLLQFTLAQLWEARNQTEGTISPETLEAIGGLAGALARHADDVLDGMLPDERTAARRVLLQLVTVENTRAVRLREELATTAAAEGALAALVRGRLVVVRDSEHGATYEVAHEALISGWGTLKQWLSEELARRTAHEQLEAAARQWDRLRRPEDALWSGKQRAQVELLDRSQLKPLETAFLEVSQASWRRASRSRLLRALGAPLVIVALYGAFALSARYGVQKKVQRYLNEAAAARASARQRAGELSALEQRAFAAFDTADLDAGERDYARALALAGNVDDDYARGAEALENALVLDGRERAVRRAIAELIDERARFDEDNRRPVRLRATLARLSLYDADIARRFVAPVRLRLSTTPPAELHLYSYERADHYRRELVKVAGTSIDQSLAPGSYLVEAAAPGRATVRESLLLERGHDLTAHLLLPPASAVPPGFVYIPEGTFLFGAAADENMRREFYRTVPLHARHTPAYLIARHETTWAEWIDFLEALPPKERIKRTPKLTAGGFHGSVALESTPAGWHLRFVATTHEYQAARGEKIVYGSRATAQAQDWLRFPVSGIAWDDVVAYTHWLATSGRVPGARPCREDEWERAARGADGRAFPHGDELAAGDANWESTYGKQPLAFGPDEVGLHPASDSPYGLSDAAGNVWEWTQSVLKPGELVARGGSFYFATPSARSDNRESIEPTLRDVTVGVRICADPARSP